MRKLAAITVASMALTGLGVAPAMADHASTSTRVSNISSAERGVRCATKAEYRKVKHGMKVKRVRRIMDISGKLTFHYNIGGTRYTTREYKACYHPRWSMVSVDFKNGRVDGKSAYWI